jgi:4-diphosphocytidyl-2-C-methyl-D-erythritol kinase
MGIPSLPALTPMLSERRADAVVVWAPAKVNLFLEVLAKRADGYHEIATLMVAVSLYDTLEFKEDGSGQIQLHCDHPTLSTGPDNLICRAAELLRQRTGCTRGARIRLVKRIPLAAGLAGGSTDAAAALAGLNRLWQLGRTSRELAGWSAELGSDIAFFFATPAAWCTGRGEQVAPAPVGRPLHLVVASPGVGLATAEVYRGASVPDAPQSGDRIRRALAAGNVEEMGQGLHNRLQPVAQRLRPEVAALAARLRGLHPAGQLMSGSGSSLFALCRDHAEALRIARGLRNDPEEGVSLRVFLVRSCY